MIYEPKFFPDQRGYFFEAYNQQEFHSAGIRCKFVQDNQSNSSYGVIRGLHFQVHPFAQSKLIRAVEGIILDVVVDIRKGSPTYEKVFSIELSAENKKQLFIPAGFAHGFSVLSDVATVLYKCDAFYNRESERGIRFDDEELSIDWQIPLQAQIISEKDAALPALAESTSYFNFNFG